MEKMEFVQVDANAATKRARMDIEKTKLEKETNVHVKRHKREKKSLLEASQNADVVTITALIAAGADVNVQNICGETPLHIASYRTGMEPVVELLIEAGAAVNVQDKRGDTSLYLASGMGGNVNIVRALIAAGANVDVQNVCGETPLHEASFKGHKEIVELLIEAGANVNVQDKRGNTSLYLASARRGSLNIVRTLITAGASVHIQKDCGKTPLHKAASKGHMDIIELLIEAGANVNVQNVCGETPLHKATFKGHMDTIELLIKAGTNVNVQDKTGNTSLNLVSSWCDSVNIVRALITAGANVNVPNECGETPLYEAASEGCKEIVELLIEAGADINTANTYRDTALHKASFEGHREVVELLIEAGADINAVNDFAGTVLGDVQLPSIAELLVSHIVRLQAAGLYVSEENLEKMDEFMNTHERRNKYLQHSIVCKEEVNKLKRENIMLYRLLTESEIACSNFNNPENLKDQYPEYAYILINKANEVRKEIFVNNHRPLVDALSIHYECDVKRMTFAGMKHFFNIHSDDFKEKLGNGGLRRIVDFQDVKERHIPKLQALAFETFLSKCCMKKKSKLSNH